MPIRSMTGFAQVKGQINGQLGFTLSLKSVNHRFLDLHFRMPSESDSLEMKLRRVLKEKVARGHVELTLSMNRGGAEGFSLNRELVSGYIEAFRAAAAEFDLAAQLDLNVILRMPGALDNASGRMEHIQRASTGVEGHRQAILQGYVEKLRARMQELIGANVEPERLLQEAALLVDRSDIQEELVRLQTHIQHFLSLLDEKGEVGKKLDFLLQEMNREANTLLSKTSGLAGDALKITEMGLVMKSEIEKSREQVQNVE